MSTPSSPYSESSVLSMEFKFVANPKVLKMLVMILIARHGPPMNTGIKYTLHDFRLIEMHMNFTTCVASVQQVADMSRYLYFCALQESAEGNMLLNVRLAPADTCYIIESERSPTAPYTSAICLKSKIVV
ncbi:uncharacterized protein HD556DRAFT_1311118 [Suillus plorans]|uniref:Uncharacterized protein n=1 Tax=Suillus plorans TaxID=116603 RepID=A0A9P7AHK8_9AGAM|nr:uncharacterized protein HD556DRAFT_1311118 [Suillus plorans]KAG1789718.1 hypothetical protein HD556DRAFT_1311118 [Suillus plorans]